MKSYDKNSPESIQEMFGSIAKSYDKTNSMISFQMHRLWNRRLVKESLLAPDGHLADLCCGTGEIAFSWLKNKSEQQTVYLIDFCQEMLDCAKEKASQRQLDSKHRLHYVQADVQDLPLPDNSISVMTMAYGIRNVKSPELCFKDAFRVLKPGGKLCILELTEPKNFFFKFYLRNILPIVGKFASSNRQAYEYLSGSIKSFVKPNELASLLDQSGFKDANVTPLFGSIATIITGSKDK